MGNVPRPLSGQGDPEEQVGALQAGFGLRVEQADPGWPPAAALVHRGWLHVHVHERSCTCTRSRVLSGRGSGGAVTAPLVLKVSSRISRVWKGRLLIF